jgi:uncharacterized protein
MWFKKLIKEWKKNGPKEKVLMAGGAVSLLLALVGVFLPIVPQVPFAILSAFLFSKGSPRLHQWVRRHKYFGGPVKDWEDHRVVRPKLKAFSTLAMIGAAVFAHFKLLIHWAIALDIVFGAAIIFVLTRKSKRIS